jgi:hypothetical protein
MQGRLCAISSVKLQAAKWLVALPHTNGVHCDFALLLADHQSHRRAQRQRLGLGYGVCKLHHLVGQRTGSLS